METLITNPLFGLSVVVTQEKLRYLLHLFVPLAFLPFRDKRAWFLLLPGGMITLLSTDAPPLTDIRYQYVAHFIPYIFVATVLVCARLKDATPRSKQLAAAGAMIAGTVIRECPARC